MGPFLVYSAYFLVSYAALTMTLYGLSALAVPKAAFAARMLASYICLLAAAMFGVTSSIVLRLAGKGQISQWATAGFYKLIMTPATGITFPVEDPGRHLDTVRPAVFVINHQTELDVLMLGWIIPKYCSVTAKSSLRKVPVLGWFMVLSNSIFIDRKNSRDAREAMRGAADEICSKRQSVLMFPEGTRSHAKEPVLLPFKKGAFHLAVQAQVPIVPIVVANYSHVLWVKGMVFNSGAIPVKVLEPIPTTGLTAADVDNLTTTTREIMLKELLELTAKARNVPTVAPAHTQHNGVAVASGVDMRVPA